MFLGPNQPPSDPLLLPNVPLDCDLVIKEFVQGTQFFRIHKTNRGAIYFSGLKPGQESRFRAPNQEYGTLYLAEEIFGAFRETITRSTYRRISEQRLASSCLSMVSVNRDLRLADLTGAGLTWLGADTRIVTDSSDDYFVSRQWALALWQHPDLIDGLYYRSCYDPSQKCLVLFSDRVANDALSAQQVNNSFLDVDFIPQLISILDKYSYSIGQ